MVEDQLVQLRAIVNALLMRTREGRVDWEWDETDGSGTTMLENGRVIVSKDSDFDTVIKIQDTDSNDLDQINVGYRSHVAFKTVADELYELARRSALNIDTKLESILREVSV